MPQDNIIRAGVIGWPVSHSLSPRLHGFWLKKYAVAGSYEAIPVAPEAFSGVLALLEKQGFTGANITVPYKEKIMPMLAHVDAVAKRIGAVNTIAFEKGEWCGTNTDAYGFIQNLGANSDIWRDGVALVLGAGGASRAVCVGLLDEGFDVVLANRSRHKAEAVHAHLNHPRLKVVEWADVETKMSDATLLVNTTILGMRGQKQLELSLKGLPETAYVADIVYNPEPTARTRRYSNPCTTDFLARATEHGCSVVDGLGMLLYQAQAGFEMWYGVKPDVTRTLRAHVLEGLLHETQAAE
jgi:shikimate dehydrogenase